MHPKYFGESHDMAKRDIMKWLAPNKRWEAHPMWFNERPNPPDDRAFLNNYAAALDVVIIDGESPNPNELLEAAITCRKNLLLDPDTGLWQPRNGRMSRKHVRIDHFIQIMNSPERQGNLTLIYDQSYLRNGVDIWEQTRMKLRVLCEGQVHAVAYMAHAGSRVRFIWASTNCEIITEATQRMQIESGYPCCRFIDDECGHVKDDQ